MTKILIADDEPDIRELMGLILEKNGYEVIEASSGKQVVETYKVSHPDLIITDIVMPDTNGVDIILNLRREFPGVKIIAMSGGGILESGSYLEVAKKCGAVTTLAKPFQIQELIESVNLALKN